MTPRSAAAAAWVLVCGAALAAPLSPQEEAGKRIYFDGESSSGSDITAVVANDGTTVQASVLPCASCHGDDGQGRPEGAVIPSDVRWSSLTKRYGRTTAGGRRHPPYAERTMARAIESGVDSAGTPLDPTMPRYAMSREDMESLVAFMKRLELLRDPGVLPAKLRIATVLPTRGRLADTGEVLRRVLQAWFDDLNAGGGIHGRRIELAVAAFDSDREDGLRAARRLLDRGDVFALVSPFTPRAESRLARLAEERRLPIVGPLTPFARQTGTPNHWVFFVLGGVREQARVLADHAAASLGLEDPAVAILHPAEEPLADAADAARAQLGSRGWKRVELRTIARGASLAPLAAELKRGGVPVVLFLGGDEELSDLGRVARDLDWAPVLLVPGTLAARSAVALPAAFDGKVFLAYPTLPTDETPAAVGRLARLRARGRIPERHLAAQAQACSAAAILAEALKRTGKVVRRERFVGNLEVLYEFETGLVPPVSYGPNRRVGALGGYVVAVDRRNGSFRPVGGWRRLD